MIIKYANKKKCHLPAKTFGKSVKFIVNAIAKMTTQILL